VRTAILFFPLWLGYILTIDACVKVRSGSSLWSRSPVGFLKLFLASAPAWWLFEVMNWRTRNWEYLGVERFSALEYFVLCTVSFSTVMPAVFETAELVRTFPAIDRIRPRTRIQPGRAFFGGLFATGLILLACVLTWPKFAYPFVWMSLFFLIEPINIWLGRTGLTDTLRSGDWRPWISLSIGALICGFFWELWNFHSYPKWIYHTPGFEFLHVFEMPLLGYGGYLCFAWELYALRTLLSPHAPPLRL
jgi:hypothetical protein